MLTFTLRMLYRMGLGATMKPPAAGKPLLARFRLWPVDMDIYGHMNNACYLRVAELSRWQQFTQVGLFPQAARGGWMFLVVDQTARYKAPIHPLETFQVRTELATENDKWLLYKHIFESEDGRKTYCEVDVRAVLKKSSGKTIRPSEVADRNSWVRDQLASEAPRPASGA